MATMNVSLPDPMKDWVEAQTRTGRYSNASDYVRDLIRRCCGAWRQESGVLPWFLDLQAARTDSGRPMSSMRLRTVTAIWVSASCAGRAWERKVSPMIRLYRLIAPSAPALAL